MANKVVRKREPQFKLKFAAMPSSFRYIIVENRVTNSNQALARSTVETAVSESNKIKPVTTNTKKKVSVINGTAKAKKLTKAAKEEETE